jgi:hypothetical protein
MKKDATTDGQMSIGQMTTDQRVSRDPLLVCGCVLGRHNCQIWGADSTVILEVIF